MNTKKTALWDKLVAWILQQNYGAGYVFGLCSELWPWVSHTFVKSNINHSHKFYFAHKNGTIDIQQVKKCQAQENKHMAAGKPCMDLEIKSYIIFVKKKKGKRGKKNPCLNQSLNIWILKILCSVETMKIKMLNTNLTQFLILFRVLESETLSNFNFKTVLIVS